MHMATNKWSLIVLFIGVVLSCKKPKHTPTPVDPQDTSVVEFPVGLSFLMDSTGWLGRIKWTAATCTAHVNFGSIPETTLNIETYDTLGKQAFNLHISEWHGVPGVYDGTSLSSPSFFFNPHLSTGGCKYLGQAGSITITRVSENNIQGTFKAIMVACGIDDDTLIFTKGSFNIPYRPI